MPSHWPIADQPHPRKGLDIEVFGGEDDLEEHPLADRNELLVPLAEISRSLAGLVMFLLGVSRGQRLALVVLAVL